MKHTLQLTLPGLSTQRKTTLRETTRRGILGAAVALTAMMQVLAAQPAAAQTPVKFALDWLIIGNHIPFTTAIAKKFFDQQGLKVEMDRGYGSGDTIAKVGNGVYDFGFADANLLLKWNNDNPDAKVTMVFLVYDGTQSAVMTTKASGIKNPKDLEGRKVGAPPSDNTRQMFPVYARAAGVDEKKINWIAAAPNLTNPMLFDKQLDAITSQEPTTFLALTKLGAKPEDVVSLRYGTYLPELLGSGILVAQKTLKEKPDLVKAFVRAVVMGEVDSIAHPAQNVETLKMIDPLADTKSELIRFDMAFEMAMQNPLLKSDGLGAISQDRLRKAMGYMGETFNVPVPADLSSIYDTSFLPPAADRKFSGYQRTN